MASLYDFSPSRRGAPPGPTLARSDCVYTSQYCEENVWHLLRRMTAMQAAAAEALPRFGSADESLWALSSPRLSPPVPDIVAQTPYDARAAVPDVVAAERSRSLTTSPMAAFSRHGPTLGSDALELYAVFITNANRQAMIWCQRKARSPSSFVVWDYHVIALARDPRVGVARTGASWVYDLDSTLDFPVPLDEHLWKSFRPNIHMDPHFASCFRVVPAALFLDHFASDRTHMLTEDGRYMAPPPPYPPIQSSHYTMNLMDYLDLGRETVGAQTPADTVVVRLTGLARRFGVKWPSPIADGFGLFLSTPAGAHSPPQSDPDDAGIAFAHDDSAAGATVVVHERTWSGSGSGLPAPVAGHVRPTGRPYGADAIAEPRRPFELAPSQLDALLARRGSAPGAASPWAAP